LKDRRPPRAGAGSLSQRPNVPFVRGPMVGLRPPRDALEGNPTRGGAMRRTTAGTAAAIALALALVLVTGASPAENPSHRGGVYRVGMESLTFTNSLAPTGEYASYGLDILTTLLVRPLVGYNHVAGAAGNVLVPDAATALPRATDGGRTYTFHIK